MGDNFRTETNKNKPVQYGHHLARAYVSWPGVFTMGLTLIFGFVSVFQFFEYIDWQGLTLGMDITIFAVSSGLWLFDVFYWSATHATRPALDGNKSEITTKPVNASQKKERLLKSNGDQHLLTTLMGYSGWIAIMMAIFYAKYGFHIFQPLSFSPSGPEITTYLFNKIIQVAMMAMAGQAFQIAISTDRDTARRLTFQSKYTNVPNDEL